MVATEENVLAALNVDNGEILWRRILEKDERGTIHLLQALNEDSSANSLRVSGRQEPDRYAFTVTGTNFVLVRGWNIRSGNLAWEWTVSPNTAASGEQLHWFYSQSMLYHVAPAWSKSIVEVTAYNLKQNSYGQQTATATKRIPIPTSQPNSCQFVKSYLVCSSSDEVVSVDLVTGASKTVVKSNSQVEAVDVCRNRYWYFDK